MLKIRDVLNRELCATNDLPKNNCTLSRDRNALIVRSGTDREVYLILGNIDKNKKLKI